MLSNPDVKAFLDGMNRNEFWKDKSLGVNLLPMYKDARWLDIDPYTGKILNPDYFELTDEFYAQSFFANRKPFIYIPATSVGESMMMSSNPFYTYCKTLWAEIKEWYNSLESDK